MANVVPNPYNLQTPLGQALGQALSATGQVLASGPSQEDRARAQAQADYYAANTGKARAETAGINATNAAPAGLADTLRKTLSLVQRAQAPVGGAMDDLNAGQPIAAPVSADAAYYDAAPAMLQQLTALNPNNPNYGENLRALMALVPGVSDQGLTQSQIGAGQAFNQTIGGTREGFTAEQQKQDSVNSTSRLNNGDDNAMRELIAQQEESGRNARFTVNAPADTTVYAAPNNPIGPTQFSGPSVAMPKQAAADQAAAARADAENAVKLLIEQSNQAGQDRRYSVNTGAGSTTSLPANSPIGKTQIDGVPTTETVRGATMAGYGLGGAYDDPNKPMTPGSPAAVLAGMTALPVAKDAIPKNWMSGTARGRTFDGKMDADTGQALPQGAVIANEADLNPPAATARTGKNWAAPGDQRGVTIDGITDQATGKTLPQGWQYSTDVNPSGVKLKAVPAGATQAMLDNKQVLDNIDKTLTAMTAAPGSTGWKGYVASAGSMGNNLLNNTLDPNGTDVRSNLANIGSQIIHDRSGAAVTISETPRLAPFVPLITDSETVVRTKIARLRAEIKSMLSDQFNSYSPDTGYIGNPTVGQFLEMDIDPQGGAGGGAAAEETKTIEGKTYVKTGGHWYEQ